MSEPYQRAVGGGMRSAPQAPLNRLSAVALVAALILPLVGIVLGHLALRQVAHTGERGRTLAVAATSLAYLVTFGAAFGIAAYLATLTGMLAS